MVKLKEQSQQNQTPSRRQPNLSNGGTTIVKRSYAAKASIRKKNYPLVAPTRAAGAVVALRIASPPIFGHLKRKGSSLSSSVSASSSSSRSNSSEDENDGHDDDDDDDDDDHAKLQMSLIEAIDSCRVNDEARKREQEEKFTKQEILIRSEILKKEENESEHNEDENGSNECENEKDEDENEKSIDDRSENDEESLLRSSSFKSADESRNEEHSRECKENHNGDDNDESRCSKEKYNNDDDTSGDGKDDHNNNDDDDDDFEAADGVAAAFNSANQSLSALGRNSRSEIASQTQNGKKRKKFDLSNDVQEGNSKLNCPCNTSVNSTRAWNNKSRNSDDYDDNVSTNYCIEDERHNDGGGERQGVESLSSLSAAAGERKNEIDGTSEVAITAGSSSNKVVLKKGKKRTLTAAVARNDFSNSSMGRRKWNRRGCVDKLAAAGGGVEEREGGEIHCCRGFKTRHQQQRKVSNNGGDSYEAFSCRLNDGTKGYYKKRARSLGSGCHDFDNSQIYPENYRSPNNNNNNKNNNKYHHHNDQNRIRNLDKHVCSPNETDSTKIKNASSYHNHNPVNYHKNSCSKRTFGGEKTNQSGKTGSDLAARKIQRPSQILHSNHDHLYHRVLPNHLQYHHYHDDHNQSHQTQNHHRHNQNNHNHKLCPPSHCCSNSSSHNKHYSSEYLSIGSLSPLEGSNSNSNISSCINKKSFLLGSSSQCQRAKALTNVVRLLLDELENAYCDCRYHNEEGSTKSNSRVSGASRTSHTADTISPQLPMTDDLQQQQQKQLENYSDRLELKRNNSLVDFERRNINSDCLTSSVNYVDPPGNSKYRKLVEAKNLLLKEAQRKNHRYRQRDKEKSPAGWQSDI